MDFHDNFVNKGRAVTVEKVALDDTDTGGGVLSWLNPEDGAIAIVAIELDITDGSDAASTLDVGTTATNATTSSDNLIDGLSGATPGLFNNTGDAGANGKSHQRLAEGKWLTISKASGAAAGLVGSAYIHYHLL